MHIVHVTGCDGSGKSTIIEKFKPRIPFVYVKEPYNRDIKKSIKTVDSLVERINIYAADRHNLYECLVTHHAEYVMSDRSFICSMVYQSLECHLTPLESLSYIYKVQKSYNIPMPTHVVYVEARPILIMERLKKRPAAEHLTEPQIKAIHERYLLVFKVLNIEPIIVNTSHTSADECVAKIYSKLYV